MSLFGDVVVSNASVEVLLVQVVLNVEVGGAGRGAAQLKGSKRRCCANESRVLGPSSLAPTIINPSAGFVKYCIVRYSTSKTGITG